MMYYPLVVQLLKYILYGISEHGGARANSDDVMRTMYVAGDIIFIIVHKSLVNDLLHVELFNS